MYMVFEIGRELSMVFRVYNDLIGQQFDVVKIFIGDFGIYVNFGSFFNGGFEFFGQDF